MRTRSYLFECLVKLSTNGSSHLRCAWSCSCPEGSGATGACMQDPEAENIGKSLRGCNTGSIMFLVKHFRMNVAAGENALSEPLSTAAGSCSLKFSYGTKKHNECSASVDIL